MPPSPQSTPAGETMPRSEVEQLLAAAQAEPNNTAEKTEPPAAAATSGSAKFDIPAASVFSEEQFRLLRARHEDYLRSLAGRLSEHLRLECGLQMLRLETVRFHAFRQALSNPTHLAMFRLEPLNGLCLLELPPRLGLSIVDRELGGSGAFQGDPRELTQMEIRLIARVVELITTEWCSVWTEKAEVRPVLSGSETCPRFVHTHPPEQVLLALGMELRVGEMVETMQMALPLTVVEPLLARADAGRKKVETASKAEPAPAPRWNAILDDVPVRLTAEWHGVEITARQLGELKPGDVLSIASGTAERVQILLESRPKYSGNLGTAGENWAVKIAEVLRG